MHAPAMRVGNGTDTRTDRARHGPLSQRTMRTSPRSLPSTLVRAWTRLADDGHLPGVGDRERSARALAGERRRPDARRLDRRLRGEELRVDLHPPAWRSSVAAADRWRFARIRDHRD